MYLGCAAAIVVLSCATLSVQCFVIPPLLDNSNDPHLIPSSLDEMDELFRVEGSNERDISDLEPSIPFEDIPGLNTTIVSAARQQPPYSGTAYQISRNTVMPTDPTSYVSIRWAGMGVRTIFSRLTNSWQTVNAFLYMASFNDQQSIAFQVHPHVGTTNSLTHSTWLAKMYGRIPVAFRSCVKEFWVLPGNHGQGAGGSPNGPSVMVHINYALDKQREGNIEELFIHESAHACLDHHMRTSEWRRAMYADGRYISTYARDNPSREDMAESSVSWFAVRRRRERQPTRDVQIVEATIPNRLNYLDRYIGGSIRPTTKPPTEATTPGACSDSNVDPWNTYCSSWASYCSYHSGVQQNCKKTCNLCGGSCSNTNVEPWKTNCVYWTSYCSHHTGVQENCKKTCNLCT